MKIHEIIALLQNRVLALNGEQNTAERLGDVARVLEIDAKIAETNATIEALREAVQ